MKENNRPIARSKKRASTPRNKLSIGYISFKCWPEPEDEELITELQRRLNVIHIVYEEVVDAKQLARKLKECRVVVNNSVIYKVTYEAIELTKTMELMGKRVINTSQSFFYDEEKWMFYLRCLEHGIPTPKTYFIPKRVKHDEKTIKDILKKGPIVLKSTISECGACVERAKTYEEFKRKLRSIMNKNPASPIIAQEYIEHGVESYRVTLIGHKAEQAIKKVGKDWKQTGCRASERYVKVRITPTLRRLCERTSKAFGMDICGIDLFYKNKQWTVIEINSLPYMKFIPEDKTRLIRTTADYLEKIVKDGERRRTP